VPAKKQINLFPKKAFSKSSAGKFLRWSLTYGRYIIIATEIIVLLAFISRFKLDRDLNDLREEIAQKQAIVQANRDFEIEFRIIQNRLLQIADLANEQTYILTLLEHIEALTPQEIFFKSLLIDEKQVTFSSYSVSPKGLTLFVNNIRRSNFFGAVTIQNLKQTEEGNIDFTLSATLIDNNDTIYQ